MFPFLFAGQPMAGEAPAFLPKRQPLAVARAAEAANVSRLLDTRQAWVLGLSDADFSARPPGMRTGPGSWRDFLEALEKSGAENVWYCLTQGGSILDRQSSGMGWQWPAGSFDAASASAWLREHGFRDDRLAVEWQGDGRLLIARDQPTAQDLLGGGVGENKGDWTGRFAAFMRGNPEGAGVWFNPRPVMGVAALVTGVDVRQLAARLNLNPPEAASLDLYPNGDHIGFDLRLDGVFPEPPDVPALHGVGLGIAGLREDGLRLSLSRPRDYLRLFGHDRNYLYPINVDMEALLPEAAAIDLWMGKDGAVHWALAWLVEDGAKFRRQWKRVNAWLDVLAAAPEPPITVADTSVGGREAREIRFGEHTVIVGAAECDLLGGGNMLVLAAGDMPDYPDPGAVTLVDAKPGLVAWQCRLDVESRLRLAEAAADAAMKMNVRMPGPELLLEAVPEGEDGGVRVVDDALVLSSPKGLALWLALPEVERRAFGRRR